MTRWDSDAEARLLAVIVQDLASRGTKFEYAAIAEAFGQGVTAKAIQNRISILRNKPSLDVNYGGDGGTNHLLPETTLSTTPVAKRKNQKVIKSGVNKPKRKEMSLDGERREASTVPWIQGDMY